MSERRYRQVHLDFHTSADCQDVGARFDPGGEPLELTTRDGYARVDPLPIGAHAVVVLE